MTTATTVSAATVEVTPALVQAISFLAAHFQDDICHSQAGPYEYSDQERDSCNAVAAWAADLCRELGVDACQLAGGQSTYHQADSICEERGYEKQDWLN